MKWLQIIPWQVKRFSLAIVLIVIASTLRIWPLQSLGSTLAWLTYYPAVMIIAVYGGFLAGLFATVLACLITTTMWHLLVALPFIKKPADWLGLIVFVITSTMISSVAEAMRRAKDRANVAQSQAETANKAKSAFLANMSHELRTPLNAILGYSQLMQREQNLRPELREYLTIINRSGEHLLSLINEVLEIAKIESGRVVLIPVNFNIRAMLEDIQKMFWEKTEYKGLHFEMQGIGLLPRFIVADETKLRIVLINLLGNAVKFTNQGQITARFSLMKQLSEELFLHVEVEDTGSGIAANEIDKLFNYFIQTESGRKSQAGTGLGLAISRDYVKMMGGEINVTSQLGEGSTFRFDIKITEGKESDVGVLSPVRRIKSLTPESKVPRVLIAEDTDESRKLLVTLLQDVGFEIRTAINGKEAVEISAQWKPDFIWMDMRMPVMDGKEAP